MNEYNTNIQNLTCTCKDWEEVRHNFEINDPRRLCKHIINKLNIENLSVELKYFKDSIAYYQNSEKGFNTHFDDVLYIPKADCKVLYAKDDWSNIFTNDGEKFGLAINSFSGGFKWSEDKKPNNFQEIELFFDEDKYLIAIKLFDDELKIIKENIKKDGFNPTKIELAGEYAPCADSLVYHLELSGNDDESIIEVSNETIEFTSMFGEGYSGDTIYRNQEKIKEAQDKRKEKRKEINWYLEQYKIQKEKEQNPNYNEEYKLFEEIEKNINLDLLDNDWEKKLVELFQSAVIDKGLMLKFESYKLPRFVSEFLVSNFIAKYGLEDGIIKVEEYLSKHYPKPNSTDLLHYTIQRDNEINIIDNFKVSVHIERHGNSHSLSIPALNISNAIIENHDIIEENPRLLNSGLWGIGKITRTDDEKMAVLAKFKPFQVSSIDVNIYKENRASFTSDEWISAILSTIGFSPNTFKSTKEKLIIISRLLPLIQKSTFLFEFGKPGTGKTYIFDKLSNSSFVISGSKITPANLFRDCSSSKSGLLKQYESILFDEIDKINNSDFADEIINKLLKFMESNTFDRCGVEMTSDTSLIFSGNIPKYIKDKKGNIPDFFAPLASKLKGEAFLDRFNGVIPGWELKPLSNVNKNFSTNQGFSADYFSAILSELRLEDIEAKIESMLEFSTNTTNRDGKAIVKSISGFFKIIFPNMDIDDKTLANEIISYCVELRQYIINERYKLYGNEEDLRVLEVCLIK